MSVIISGINVGCPICGAGSFSLWLDQTNSACAEYVLFCVKGHEVKRFFALQPVPASETS